MSTAHGDATAAATNVVIDAGAPPPPSKSDNLFMQIVVHPDGTVTCPFVPTVPASSGDPAAVQSRDVPLDAALGTYLRLYLPPIPASKRLPVILYLHGGGFVLFSPATVFYHASCEAMAAAVPAIIVSIHYRLAPEHRLPAAYHDADAALLWLRSPAATADPWLAAHADLDSSRCFLMGSSSGANIAFHAALRSPSVSPIAGVVMHQPYLGGVERTASEAASEDDAMLPLEASDKLWRLALPVGADRDHAFSYPAKSMAASADLVGLPRCLLSGSVGDPLIDRQRAFAGWLRDSGVVKEVVEKTDGQGFHAAELFVPEIAEELFAAVRGFVYGDGVPSAVVVVGDDEPPVSVAGAALT